MRRDALRRYFIYRMKLMELLHFYLLWDELTNKGFTPSNDLDHVGLDFSQTIRTATLSWYCSIVDLSRGGLNVFDLWRELFPKHREEIDTLWSEVAPSWEILRGFRDNCGFHASTPRQYFAAKQRLLDNPQVAKAMDDFIVLAKRLMLAEEEELHDFVPEVEAFLLDLELESTISVSRDALKRLLILPRGNYTRVFG